MKTKRHVLSVAAPLCALALVATACGGGGGGNSSGGGGSSGQKLPADTVQINQTATDQIKDGGTLRWPVDQYSSQWNYNQLNGPEASTFSVVYSLMPDVYKVEADGTAVADPNYVTSMKLTSTSPKQVVTYELNPKAKWSDGTPITWKDFAAQEKALNGKNAAFQVASSIGYDHVASVTEGKNQFEVKVTFAKPYADWRGLFGPLYPAKYNSTPKLFNSGYLNKIPVTAGPFKLGSLNSTQQTVTVERDPKWWGPKPKLDSIVFRTLSDAATAQSFANGEIDFFTIGSNASNYKMAKGVKGTRIDVTRSLDWRHVTFNGRSPKLSDPKVRQAIALGVNRTAIASSDLQGLPEPAVPLNNHIFVNGQKGYQDNAGAFGKYSPSEAKKMLDAAGWKLGSGGIRSKGGQKLELRLVIPAQTGVATNEAQLLSAMMQQIGVKIDINSVPTNDFFDKYVSPGNFDLTVFTWLGNAFPVSGSYSIYQNPTGSGTNLNIYQNYSRVGTDQIDAAFQKALSNLDPKGYIDDSNAADKLLWPEMQNLPFYQRSVITAAKSTLANLGSTTFPIIDYTKIGFHK